MLETYFKYSQGTASAAEMNIANEQFRQILKSAGLGALLILPFAPVTIPTVVKLAKKFGVDILPGYLSTSRGDNDKAI